MKQLNKIQQHSLRKRLDARLIKLVKPEGMSEYEYRIACELNNIVPSVENGQFLHWLMTADGDRDITDKVLFALTHALEKKYLLDIDSIEQQSYFCDAVKAICIKDKEWTAKILDAVLKNYKETEAFNFCKTLNKAFGFTQTEYFDSDGICKAVRAAVQAHRHQSTLI